MNKLHAHLSYSLSIWINPVNVAEIANKLLTTKIYTQQKSNKHKLNKLLNKLDQAFYCYHYRSMNEKQSASIDLLEQDLLSLIIYVKEIVLLLTPANRQKLKLFAMIVLNNEMNLIKRENNTISISWG